MIALAAWAWAAIIIAAGFIGIVGFALWCEPLDEDNNEDVYPDYSPDDDYDK